MAILTASRLFQNSSREIRFGLAQVWHNIIHPSSLNAGRKTASLFADKKFGVRNDVELKKTILTSRSVLTCVVGHCLKLH